MKKIAIIGSGLGGIALAIRLQSQGLNTILFEQHDKPGGCAYVYHDKGFTFDAGPTVITELSLIKELFIMAKKNINDYINMIPINPLYKICWESGQTFNYENNQQEIEKQIKKFNCNDIAGYQKFLKYSQSVFNEAYLKFSHKPFLSFYDMISITPKLIKLKAWRSVYNTIASFIQNEQLRQVFSFHTLLVGGNPFTTSSIYTLIHALERKEGIWFPKGGIGNLIKKLITVFKDIGGKLVLNAKIKSIKINNNLIKEIYLEDNRIFKIIAIASNADIVFTYSKLLKKNDNISKYTNKLYNMNMSNSLFIVYFGLNYLHKQLAHHTICFSSNYYELINNIFYGKSLKNKFSLYLNAPSLTDNSLAPKGCGSYYVLTPVPNLSKTNFNWNIEGPKLGKKILQYLEKFYIPNLFKQLITCHIFTPNDFYNQLNTFHGSAFSFEPKISQSAWFRPHNIDKNIKNLFFIGSGTQPGAGIPGVLNSAKATTKLILKFLK